MNHRFTRRHLLRTTVQTATLVALASCTSFPDPQPTRPPAPSSIPTIPSIVTLEEKPMPTQPSTATTAINLDVDLEVKIGQLLMAGFRGLRANDAPTLLADIRQRHLGCVVLFDYDVPSQSPVRNVESPEQVKNLLSELKAAAQIPLLVAVDQEGGIIRRLKTTYGFPATVSHQFLGQQNDLTLTQREASAMAQTLAEVGFNLNLAPVVDLNINPNNPIIGKYERSFSAEPEVVIAQAEAFMRAHRQQGVLTTLKHFPGHGSSLSDSHLGLVDVSKTWQESELQPYATLIKRGLADTILTAHVFTKFDSDWPATFSYKTITGVLRQQLGWDGVVISDDMFMGAITLNYGFETAVVQAINAGVDLLALGNNGLTYIDDIVAQAVSIIQQAVKDGRISMARINESYARIQRLKQRMTR